MRQQIIRFGAVMALLAGAFVVGSANSSVRADAGEGVPGAPRALGERLATGFSHTCVLVDTGEINCWGRGTYGQTGHGTTAAIGDDEDPGAVPDGYQLTMPGLRKAVAITAGYNHTCALLTNATVVCWGNNTFGQLGYGNTNDIGDDERPNENPVNGGILALPANAKVAVVAAGGNHTCAITVDGDVYCWGDNAFGQLGYGNTNDIGDNESLAARAPVKLPIASPVGLALGARHTCVLSAAGTVSCWGEGQYGQLGMGNTNSIGDNEVPESVGVPVDLGFVGATTIPLRASAITAGDAHTCAIVTGARVKCWGAAGYGQLGRGNSTPIGDNETPAATTPLNIGNNDAIESVSAGDIHTCATTIAHVVYCWGNSDFGQAGQGTTVPIGDTAGERPNAPVQLPNGLGARVVSAGAAHTCVVLDGNNVTCWGQATFGQLGYGNINHIGDNEFVAANPVHGGRVLLRASPVNTVALAVGHGAHTCAIVRGGSVSCWGANSWGQLGLARPDAIGDDELPETAGTVALPENRAALALAIGEFHTCALLAGGKVSCWGNGANGRLGYGNTAPVGDNETPATGPGFVQLPGGATATAIATGMAHTCALLASGKVTCWGANGSGQLGYGNTNAIGDNETPANNPTNGGTVALPGGYTARAIAAGGNTTCAILLNDALTCWGENSFGQLGFGNTNAIGDTETPANNPVAAGFIPLGGGVRVLQVSVGRDHVCAVRTDFQLLCWGSNEFGQLGSGAGTGAAARIGDNEFVTQAPNGGVVPSGRQVRSVSAGWAHTCAIDSVHKAYCWGAGSAGRLGYGNTATIGDNETAAFAAALTNLGLVEQVAANNSHTCDVHSGGLLYCWGYGGHGRLGFGNATDIGDNEEPGAVELLGVRTANSMAPTEYTPNTLTRLLDTRAGQPFEGGAGTGQKLSPATGVQALLIAGRGGVAPDATAVSLNFTITGAVGNGFLRAYPCLTPSTASTLNFTTGSTVANHTIMGLGDSKSVCIEVSSAVHVIVDVAGAFGPSSQVHAISPARLLDTRPGQPTIDGSFSGVGVVPANGTVTLQVAGRGGVPIGATAVWLNTVAVGPTGNGFVTAYPCGIRPLASSLNYVAGVNRANGALVKLNSSGQLCLYTNMATHLLADVTASVDPSAPVTVNSPVRLVDTRVGQQTIDGIDAGGGAWAANTSYDYSLRSRVGIEPAGRAVVLNVTGLSSTNGYITIARCFSGASGSTINIGPGKAVANTVIVELFPGDRICGTSSVAAQVIIDLEGTLY